MRIYSFARSAGHRIHDFGSDFVLSPLMNPAGAARVACFHLTSGELVGEHKAAVGQLFCVVGGEGWVSGNDGVRTQVRAQQAAYWEPGETHAAGSDSGLTAIVLEGNSFEVRAKPADDET